MGTFADSLPAEFLNSLNELNVSSASSLVVAVSGGLDSMVLLRLLSEQFSLNRRPERSRPGIQVAHLNHGLRGSESDADQTFVEAACRCSGLPFVTKTLAVGQVAEVRKQSTEEAARSIRYAWLEEVAIASRADVILTAHHSDDQIETVVHNLLRGTGLRGIQGMQAVRRLKSGVRLVRPLLSCSRSRLREYAESKQITFREDSSNENLEFTRNRLRHQVLPCLLEQGGAGVTEELLRLSKSASDASKILDRMSGMAAACIVTRTDDHVLLRASPLMSMPDFARAHFFTWLWRQQNWARQRMTEKHWQKLSKASVAGSFKRFQLPGRVDVSSVSGFIRFIRGAA